MKDETSTTLTPYAEYGIHSDDELFMDERWEKRWRTPAGIITAWEPDLDTNKPWTVVYGDISTRGGKLLDALIDARDLATDLQTVFSDAVTRRRAQTKHRSARMTAARNKMSDRYIIITLDYEIQWTFEGIGITYSCEGDEDLWIYNYKGVPAGYGSTLEKSMRSYSATVSALLNKLERLIPSPLGGY